jgi:hypothetical protein
MTPTLVISLPYLLGFQASSLPYLRRLQVWVYPLVILSCLMTIDDVYVKYWSYEPRRLPFPSMELPIHISLVGKMIQDYGVGQHLVLYIAPVCTRLALCDSEACQY